MDLTIELPALAGQAKRYRRRHQAPCFHHRYMLDCEQYDELHDRAERCCEICRVHESELWGYKKLNVDHDHAIGNWAVRGLLCTRCNVGLEHGKVTGPEVDAYLTNAWYMGIVRERGLTLGAQPEPDLWTMAYIVRRGHWLRDETGWVRLDLRRGRGEPVVRWPWLCETFGAHNLNYSSFDPNDLTEWRAERARELRRDAGRRRMTHHP